MTWQYPNDFPFNLDSYDTSDLRVLSRVFKSLAEYADLKIVASDHRLTTGDTESALNAESKMDKIYKSLPSWAKW